MKRFFAFFFIVTFLTCILFWEVIFQNKIPFSANLLASSFNPWMQEKFPKWEVGIPNKPTGKDDVWIFFPQRSFTTSVLKKGEIPYWNPYSFTGNYHVGLSETAVFYPFNFLFLFFSQTNVWVFLIFIQPIVTGLGMYLFLKQTVVNEKSAIVGALAFAFSGIVITRSVEGLSVGHTLIWLPYVFWGIASFFKTKRTRFLLVILLALIMSLLSGWFQFTFYIFVFSLSYAFYGIFSFPKKSKRIYLVFLPFLLFPLVGLFHIIPAFQALLDSPRSALEGRVFSSHHLVSITHLFTLIIPDFWGNPAVYTYFGKSDYKESMLFVGVVPLILSLFSFFKTKKREELFFWGVIITSLVLAIDNPLSRFIISLPLPVISSFLPDRIFLITTFSIAVLSALGFDYLLQEENLFKIKKVFAFVWFTVIVLVLFIGQRILKDPTVLFKVDRAGVNISTDAIQFRNLVIPIVFLFITTGVFIMLRRKYSTNVFFSTLVAILFFQSFLFGQKYIPFSNRQFMYPSHPVFTYLKNHQNLDRFMSIGFGHIVPSIPLQFGLYSPEGIGSMYIRRYGEFVRYMKLGDYGIPDKIAFDLEIYPKDVFKPQNKRLHRFFQLTNVKHIVADKKSLSTSQWIPSIEDFSLVWENEKWQIYEYKKSMPRFFVTSSYKIITSREKILDALFSDSFSPQTVILEENPGFESKNLVGKVEVSLYSPNKIIMKSFAENKALVYFSDNYSKAFKVLVDGKEEKILRANYTFRAIPVTAGNHEIVVFYDIKKSLLDLLYK